MHLPTRRQEQTTAAAIALTVVILTLVDERHSAAPALGASISALGPFVVVACDPSTTSCRGADSGRPS